jgi:N-acylneuraminate cytidylyltransferase
MVKNIAIIPARGGSKRVPKKNILDFDGKPMIAWTIEAAINSNIFSKVLVSTDCNEIAEISKSHGAEVPFLRRNFYDDITPVSEATCDALKQAEDCWDEEFDCVVQLMANCPLRNNLDIVKSMDAFIKNKRDFQISCFKFGWMNPWWAFKFNESGGHESMFPDAQFQRSQDLDDLFCPTGSIWIAKGKELKDSNTFYGNNYKFEEINWISAVDIDDYDDLNFAKAVKNFQDQV